MKKVSPLVLKMLNFCGIIWFSFYAFSVNESKRSTILEQQIKVMEKEHSESKQKLIDQKINLQNSLNIIIKERHDMHETMLIMFPSEENKERIDALFKKDSEEIDENSSSESEAE